MLTQDNLTSIGVESELARSLIQELSRLQAADVQGESLWHHLRQKFLHPEQPFGLHQLLRDYCFRDWDVARRGPHPLWQATEERRERTNLAGLMRETGQSRFEELYQWSIQNGRAFWSTMIRRLGVVFQNQFVPTPENVVDLKHPRAPEWLLKAKLNLIESCFLAPAEAIALRYQHDGSSTIRDVTYDELNRLSNRVADALQREGIQQGDRIAIDMPFNVEAIAIYLGILKLGAVAVCLADSFRAPEIAVRLRVAMPVKLLFTQDFTGGNRRHSLYAIVASAENAPPMVVVHEAESNCDPLREGDRSWQKFLAHSSEKFTPVPISAHDWISLLFTSSTSTPKESVGQATRAPKAIPWNSATALKSVIDAHLYHDLQPGKVLCWPTNLGWMMGSFSIFAALVNRGTLAVFDGNASSREFAKFVEKAKVNILGLVPTLSESWQSQNAVAGCDWSGIELFSSTGSPSNPANYFWLMSRVPGYAPCFEYMGGTEVGGGYITGSYYQAASPSSFTTPTLGTELVIWAKDDEQARAGELFIVMGNRENRTPPMGVSTSLLNGDHDQQYFGRNLYHSEGEPLREHGDLLISYPGGFIRSNGRADDGLNLNGIKTSALDLENYIKDAQIPGIRDIAAIAHRPAEGGEDRLVIFIVMQDRSTGRDSEIKKPIREAIKERNPQLALVYDVIRLPNLPLTASGKLRRRYLQDLYLEEFAANRPN